MDDAGSLVFDSVPLDHDLDLLGSPVLDLTFSVDRPVAQDGNLITSRKPDDLPAFCREIIRALAKTT